MNLSRRERGLPRTAGVWRKQTGGSIDGQQQAVDDKGESNAIAAEEEECAVVADIKAYPRAAAQVASREGQIRSEDFAVNAVQRWWTTMVGREGSAVGRLHRTNRGMREGNSEDGRRPVEVNARDEINERDRRVGLGKG